jgi:hypothetical protein
MIYLAIKHHPPSDSPIQVEPQQPAVPVMPLEDRNICFIQEAINICIICQFSVKWMLIRYPSYCGETGYLGDAFMGCSDFYGAYSECHPSINLPEP